MTYSVAQGVVEVLAGLVSVEQYTYINIRLDYASRHSTISHDIIMDGGEDLTYIMHNTWILITVRSRKPYTIWQFDTSVAQNFNLHAIRVELSAAARIVEVGDVGFVQGDEFCAD
jgi:hypothetical protein